MCLLTVGLSHKENCVSAMNSAAANSNASRSPAPSSANPAAILADEPTGALDSENGSPIMTILAASPETPTARVMVVTHDPRIVPFADRIVQIEDGYVEADSPREAVPWPEFAEPVAG